jgi:hypothetical protein
MSDELNLIAFNAIAQFMKELNTIFGKKYRPIALYNRLISKTTLMHQNAISRHISVFRDFCTVNRTCIITRNTELKDDVIFYSETVSIFMKEVFNLSEKEEDSDDIKEGIWKHLLTISALLDPSGRAKDVLKKSVVNEIENVRESTPVRNTKSETNFINNIIEKVEKNIDPNVSDPMQAVSSMMKSGVFTDLLSDITNGMKSGELDINKMFSAVNEMVSKEGVGNDESNPLGNHMNMLSSMMSSMNSGQNSEGGNDMGDQIDPMSMLSSMMSSMNSGQNSEGGNDMLSSIMSSFTSGEGSNNIMESMMQNLIQEPQRDFVNEIEDVE